MSLLDIQCIIIFMINVWCFMIIDFLSISWTYKYFLIFCKVLRISNTLYLKKKIYYYCVGVWFDHIHILVNFFNFLLFLNCVILLAIRALYIHVHNITLSVKCAREESWKLHSLNGYISLNVYAISGIHVYFNSQIIDTWEKMVNGCRLIYEGCF